MASLGDLVVNFTANTQQFNRNLKSSQKMLGGFKRMAQAAGAAIAGYLTARAAGNALDAAREQMKAERKLQAVLKATGHAAGITADEITRYASELQGMTNFGDEATINAAAMLATFKEIKGDMFFDVLSAAQDMSSVLDTDLKSSIIQLGKAFNDPVKGISALTDSGVSFTEQQKQQIKAMQQAGNLLGAQKLIMAELKSEFGGAAAAMVDPWTQVDNALGDLQEQAGGVLLKLGEMAGPTIVKQVQSLGSAFDSLSDDDMQNLAGLLSDITSALVEAAKVMGGLASKARDAASGLTAMGASGLEAVGAVPKGTVDEFVRMRNGTDKLEGARIPQAFLDKVAARQAAEAAAMQQSSSTTTGEPFDVRAFGANLLNAAKPYGEMMKNAGNVIVEANKKAQDQKALERSMKMAERASAMIQRNMTPDERFQKAFQGVGDLVLGGFLTEAQGMREVARLERERDMANGVEIAKQTEVRLTAAMQRGSVEAFSLLARSEVNSGKSPEVKAQQEGNKILTAISKKLDNKDSGDVQIVEAF